MAMIKWRGRWYSLSVAWQLILLAALVLFALLSSLR
jgi:hypothetical protein